MMEVSTQYSVLDFVLSKLLSRTFSQAHECQGSPHSLGSRAHG